MLTRSINISLMSIFISFSSVLKVVFYRIHYAEQVRYMKVRPTIFQP